MKVTLALMSKCRYDNAFGKFLRSYADINHLVNETIASQALIDYVIETNESSLISFYVKNLIHITSAFEVAVTLV